jgi:hypothetical protein
MTILALPPPSLIHVLAAEGGQHAMHNDRRQPRVNDLWPLRRADHILFRTSGAAQRKARQKNHSAGENAIHGCRLLGEGLCRQ